MGDIKVKKPFIEFENVGSNSDKVKKSGKEETGSVKFSDNESIFKITSRGLADLIEDDEDTTTKSITEEGGSFEDFYNTNDSDFEQFFNDNINSFDNNNLSNLTKGLWEDGGSFDNFFNTNDSDFEQFLNDNINGFNNNNLSNLTKGLWEDGGIYIGGEYIHLEDANGFFIDFKKEK